MPGMLTTIQTFLVSLNLLNAKSLLQSNGTIPLLLMSER